MATSLTFLTPLGALVAIGVLVPLLASLAIHRRAGKVRRRLGVSEPQLRPVSAALTALVATGALVGLAAAQPILEQTTTRVERTDAEVFLVLDVSRSMLAQRSVGQPMRIDRAKSAAIAIRATLPDIPVGVASFTDRVLPHLFPGTDLDVSAATLERALGIERPPPRSSLGTSATSLDALAGIRGFRFFSPRAKKRVLVVFTDGESIPVSTARLAKVFLASPAIETVFVHFWHADERVFDRGVAEPQYLPDRSSRSTLERVAKATGGSVHSEDDLSDAVRSTRQHLGRGPTATSGASSGRIALAPYLVLATFLPVGLVLWRRDR